jgi:hypothetical protein
VTVRFLAEAKAELANAITNYDVQLPGLGAELASEVRDGLARIEEYPKLGNSSAHVLVAIA